MEINPYAAETERRNSSKGVNPYAAEMERRASSKKVNPYASEMLSRGLSQPVAPQVQGPTEESRFTGQTAGFSRDESGQLKAELPMGGDALTSGLAGGTLKAARGVATLPGDIYEAAEFAIGGTKYNVFDAFGWENAGVVSDWLDKNIPQIDPKSIAGEILQTLVQFVPAGMGGAKLGGFLARNSSKIKKMVAPIVGGATTDAAVITPDDKTFFGYAESPLGKRAETFTEGMVLGHLLEGAAKGGRVLWNKDFGIKASIKKALGKVVDNPEKAAEELSKKAAAGIELTSGMKVSDIGLKTMEGDLMSKSLVYVKRQAEIKAKTSEIVSDFVREKGGDPEQAANLFKIHYDDLNAAGKKTVDEAELAIKTNTVETEQYIDDIVTRAPDRGDASAVIDEVTHRALKQRNQKKNFLFANIDPDGTLIIPDKKPWQNLLKDVVRKTSAGDMTPGELPEKLLNTFKEMVFTKDQDLTYKALMDFRPSVVNEIQKGRATMSAPALNRLTSIRKAIDGYADELADGFADTEQGRRAAIARDYFRNEFVPEFRELTGKNFSLKAKTDPWAPSITGGKFLKNPAGFTESSFQLRTIVENSPDKEKGLTAIRDFFISDIGRLIGDTKGSAAVSKIKSYLKTPGIKESLKAYPEIRSEINGLLKHVGGLESRGSDLKNIYENSLQGFKQTERELGNSAVKFFVDKTPVKAVNSVLKGGNPQAGMRELFDLASKDKSGDAVAGLKDAYGQAIQRDVLTTTKAGDVLEVSQTKLAKMLEDPDALAALKVLYTPKEIKGLQEMRSVLDNFDSVAKKGNITPEMTTLGVENARIGFAAVYGIVKGRGLFMVTNWLSRKIGYNPQQKIQMLIEDAFLNPKTMKMLLTEVSNEKQAEALRSQFQSYWKKSALVESRHFADIDLTSETEE